MEVFLNLLATYNIILTLEFTDQILQLYYKYQHRNVPYVCNYFYLIGVVR